MPCDPLIAAIALNAIEKSPIRMRKLLDAFGSPEKVLASRAGGSISAAKISFALKDAKDEVARAKKAGVRIVVESDRDFPELLRQIPDRPVVLFVKGSLPPSDSIAVVGSRKADAYGLSSAERFGGELAGFGIGVVSGLAYGVDAAAHHGTLAGGGATFAVLGSGLLNIYPSAHARLAGKIVESGGGIISEFPLAEKPERWNFPRRNRIIAGMCRGVLVIEAAKRSGALITARLAVEYNRLVWVLPQRATDELGAGIYDLLRDGADAVSSARDIVDDIAPQVTVRHAVRSTVELADPFLAVISADGSTADEIAGRAGLPTKEALRKLLSLELEGKVSSLPGGIYRLTGKK